MKHLRRIVPPALIAVGVLGMMMPGCDELVTEVNEFTIAGHPTAEFELDGDSTNCLDSGFYCQGDSGCAPLAVRFIDLSNGPRDQWIWSFGDGVVDTVDSLDTAGINPIHVYREAGTYTVSLTILDHSVDEEPGADTEAKRRFIIVGTTIDSFMVEPDSGCNGQEVTFTPVDYGGINKFTWRFGDGSPVSLDSNPTHVYDSAGVYSCTLTVEGDCGEKMVVYDSIRITPCPDAQIWADTLMGCKPLKVHFEDRSDYHGVDTTTVVREWHFADTSANRDTFSYTFEKAGKYVVTMTTTSEGGAATDTLDDTIMVWGPAFGLTTANGARASVEGCVSDLWYFYVNFEASFPDSVDVSSFDSLVWFFGDGHRSIPTDPMPIQTVHAYDTAGEYTVQLHSWGKCADDTAIVDSVVKMICLAERFDASLAGFTITPDADTAVAGIQGDTSVTFTFTNTSPLTGVGWDWGFGDANSSTEEQPTYQYADTGTYEVSMHIFNCCNDTTLYDTIYIDTMATGGAFRRYSPPATKR